jgi:hypothetical protein
MSDTPTEKTYTIKDVEAERAHAQKFQQEAEELKNKFKGIDPEAARTALEKLQDLERKAAATDPEKIKQLEEQARIDERNKIGGKLTEYEQTLAEREARLNRYEVTQPALLEAANIFTATELPIIEMMIEKDLMKHEGKIVVRGPDGKPVPSSDPRNGYKSVSEYFGELSTKFPNLVKASVSPGGKQSGTKIPADASGVTVEKFMSMTPEQRAALPKADQQKLSASVFKKTH